MYGHISEGDMITHVDDVFMGQDEGMWERYMSGDEIGDLGRGWCVDRGIYMSELAVKRGSKTGSCWLV
jgi:hypothetical protein